MKVFTDASSLRDEEFSWSFVVETKDGLDEQYGVFNEPPETIQEAELKAILLAYYYTIQMYGATEIDVYTDNLTCVEYMQGQARLKGLFHIQKKLFELMFKNDIKTTFNHVYSHSGIKLNEIADINARKAFDNEL